MVATICIAGAGTMGSGIAFVCAQNGFNTLLFDLNTESLEIAERTAHENIRMFVAKQKMSEEEGEAVLSRLHFTSLIDECIADFFIEAIIENAAAKIALFNQLADINQPGVVFATNTSSLSVSLIQQGIKDPQRVAGMHFFNPAPVMKLVEVIAGELTSISTTTMVRELCKKLQKIPVMCKDAPGFIVNRVARPYYLEAMHLVELGLASIEEVDSIMEGSGFKMGPFKLMDLIGLDINLAVSKSVYESFGFEQRFKPSSLQEEKVALGYLGRKSGKGFYDYPK